MKLKRKVYLVALAIIIIYNTWYWLFSTTGDAFIHATLPFVILAFLGVWVLCLVNRCIRLGELIALGLFTLYYLGRIASSVQSPLHNTLYLFVAWAALYNIFIFIILRGNKGLIFSLSVYAATLIIAIPHYHESAQLDGVMTQLLVSSLIYIAVLYVFQHVLSAYIELEVWKNVALSDYLTGIPNRRRMDERIQSELSRVERTGKPLSLIYIDLDHFKTLNDTHGHQVGDGVLKQFTTVIQQVVRPEDCFGRWGGEEFLVILPETSEGQAIELAEKLRRAVEEHEFSEIGHLTASFGVSTSEPGDGPTSLVNRADHAMYMVKHHGRNAVRIERA